MSKSEPSSSDDDKQVSGAESESTTVEKAEDYHLTGLKLWIIVVGVSLAVLMMALDTSIIATVRMFLYTLGCDLLLIPSQAIPKITVQFDSTKDIGWYGSSFFLTM